MLVALSALAATVGVGLVGWAVLPRRRSLAVELDQLLAPAAAARPEPSGFLDALGASLWATMDPVGDRFPALRRDLVVTGDTPAVFAGQMVMTAGLFALLAGFLLGFAAVEGFALAPPAALAAVVLAAALGSVTPRLALRSQALERRVEMSEAVAVICDLCAVLVAAGEDIDAALTSAAEAGEGWAFDALRAAVVATGRYRGTWTALEALGERLGVDELVVLAQNMGLAEEKGAKIRDALNTQAKTLRKQAASEVEAKAGSMTERMSFPMVMLLAGFLLVIGYPAVARL